MLQLEDSKAIFPRKPSFQVVPNFFRGVCKQDVGDYFFRYRIVEPRDDNIVCTCPSIIGGSFFFRLREGVVDERRLVLDRERYLHRYAPGGVILVIKGLRCENEARTI